MPLAFGAFQDFIRAIAHRRDFVGAFGAVLDAKDVLGKSGERLFSTAPDRSTRPPQHKTTAAPRRTSVSGFPGSHVTTTAAS